MARERDLGDYLMAIAGGGLMLFMVYKGASSLRPDPIPMETVDAVPISVMHDDYSTSTVVDYQGKRLVVDMSTANHRKTPRVAALIESEILDGDEEKIRFEGWYNTDNEGTVLKAECVSVENYRICRRVE